jgi:hypothetical protein
MPLHPDLAKASAILGMVGAALVLGLNVAVGALYIRDCRVSGGTFNECWDRGLSISGLGSGGPLAAALGIGGYVIGASKGRKEGIEEGIKEGYQQGYWTLNPDLHSDNPEP